ncbi:MAG TPA: hypothetical protein VGN28_03685 [Blastococcus sp.]|nr:hypothetical protein [Blastococcus sp.]
MSYQRDTASPEERRRRQRRSRMTLLVVAAVATAVTVPLAVHVRHSWDASTPAVEGSTGSPSTPRPSPSAASEKGPDVDPERPGLYALAADASALAKSLDARGKTLTWTAPGERAKCPKAKDALSAALGVPVHYVRGSLSDELDPCAWSTGRPEGPSGDYLSVDIGFLARWTAADLQDLNGEDCWRTPVEGFAPSAVLEACLRQGASGRSWSLYVPAAGGTGVWTLEAATGDHQPVSAGVALDAVIDVAAATW